MLRNVRKIHLSKNEDKTTSHVFIKRMQTLGWTFLLHVLFLSAACFLAERIFCVSGVVVKDYLCIGLVFLLLLVLFDLVFGVLLSYIKSPVGVKIFRFLTGGIVLFFGQKAFWGYYEKHQLDLEDGFLAMAKDYIASYRTYYKANVNLPSGKEEYIVLAFLFFILALVLVQVTFSFMIAANWPVLILPLTVTVAELWVGLAPDIKGVIAFTVAVCFLAMGRETSLKGRLLALLILGITFSSCLLFGTGTAEKMVAKAPTYKAFQKQLETKVKEIKLANLWGNRETVSNKKPVFSDNRVLTITSSIKPSGNLYLRTFVGDIYENGSWVESTGSYAAACKEAGMEEKAVAEKLWNDFAKQFLNNAFSVQGQETEYTIFYEKNMQSFAMLPYYSLTEGNTKISYIADQTMKLPFGTKQYSFSGANANDTGNVLQRLIYNRDQISSKGEEWEFYNAYVNEHYTKSINAIMNPQNYINHMTSADIPLTNYLHDRDSNMKRVLIASAVSDYLCNNYTYSWNLDSLMNGEDPVDYFMNIGKKGYCMHFASAGTILLRELGIPARYVAGYVVKSTSFKKIDNRLQAEVYDRNAHAWTEIYLDGVGWVPIEMTAGYSVFSNSLPTDKNVASEREEKEKEASKENETQEIEIQEEEPEETEVTDVENERAEGVENKETGSYSPVGDYGGTGGSGMDGDISSVVGDGTGNHKIPFWKKPAFGVFIKVLGFFMGMLGVVAGVLLSIRAYYRDYHERLNRDIRRKRYTKAIKRMNRRIYKKMRKMSKGKSDLNNDLDYEWRLKETFPEIEPQKWTGYMNVVKKACFSNEEMKQKDAMLCYEIYKNLIFDSVIYK